MTPQAQSTPVVSVVIPTRGRSKLLTQRTLPTALAQTSIDYEVIVVVDGPDPETEAALADFSDARLRVIVLPSNMGGGQARNVGFQSARGEWIALLDDDDEWFPNKLKRQLKTALRSRYDQPIVACHWIIRTPLGDEKHPVHTLDHNEP